MSPQSLTFDIEAPKWERVSEKRKLKTEVDFWILEIADFDDWILILTLCVPLEEENPKNT